MSKDKELEKLSSDFLALKDKEKDYILGLTRALDFAMKNGWKPSGSGKNSDEGNKV